MLAEGRGGAMAVERKQAPRAVLLTLPLLQNHPSLGLLPPSQRCQDTVPSPCSSLSPFAFGSSELWLMFFRFSRKQRESKNNGKEGTPPGIKTVKNTYSSVEDYISPFEPLLFEEVKAQIVQRNDDDQEDSVAMVLAEHLRIPLVSPQGF